MPRLYNKYYKHYFADGILRESHFASKKIITNKSYWDVEDVLKPYNNNISYSFFQSKKENRKRFYRSNGFLTHDETIIFKKKKIIEYQEDVVLSLTKEYTRNGIIKNAEFYFSNGIIMRLLCFNGDYVNELRNFSNGVLASCAKKDKYSIY